MMIVATLEGMDLGEVEVVSGTLSRRPHTYTNATPISEDDGEHEARLQQFEEQLREQEDDHGDVEDNDEEDWSEQEDDGKHPPLS